MNELNTTTTISVTNKYLAFLKNTIIFCGNKISRVSVPSSSRICARFFRWLVRYEKAENHETFYCFVRPREIEIVVCCP